MSDRIKEYLYYLAWVIGIVALVVLLYGIITSF